MHSSSRLLLLSCLGALGVTARDVPANVRTLYNSIKAQGACSNKLATGFYSRDDSANTFSYCGDHLSDYNIIYIKGSGTAFANMDIDCDGTQGGPADDGRCGSSGDTQSITSFQDTVAGYNKGINDLNANVHPYVVFGNEGSKSGWKTFNPQNYGIKPLSIMAVVCGDKLIYGVWADENGDDGDKPVVGEASISLATACYGTSVNGNSGHDEDDVLYIAFPGTDAVPGANGANWAAANYAAFESSIEAKGNALIARIAGSTSPTTTAKTTSKTSTAATPTATCSWAGHCLGATCSTNDDCSDDLVCTSSKCAVASTKVTTTTLKTSTTKTTSTAAATATCSWAGHCLGATCATNDDCSDAYICTNKKCAVDTSLKSAKKTVTSPKKPRHASY
ncbi:fungal chitosanase of glycosyl hydrolase group 75-domain-containing protein [Cercophora scortea]|uniref:Endo-chitosanase n=1 Tax=Cercophora scortea TaxID=314031 RepID=A0AAE0M5Z7_9PEZI|nr:fungal chitosanase of glycosyl hydrolase group 75-domain-containing protein [Cercophora scortea]